MKTTAKSWQNEPLPGKRVRLHLDRSFTTDEWRVIRQGLLPDQMEDKWFIYEKQLRLYFHRSWTGFCVYEVHFRKTPSGVEIFDAWASRDDAQYSCVDDVHDTRLVSWMIDVFLLKRDVPYPSSGLASEVEPLKQWSEVGRAMLVNDADGKVAEGLDRAIRKGESKEKA